MSMNKSIKQCCICDNENIGEFICIGDKKYHLSCIEQLQQESQQLKAMLEIGKTCAFCPYYKSKEENIILRGRLKEIEKIVSKYDFENYSYFKDRMIKDQKTILQIINLGETHEN